MNLRKKVGITAVLLFYHWKQAFSASNLNREETYGHKKRSNALLQPLLTLNLIL